MVWFGKLVLDIVGFADHVEPHLAGPERIPVAGLLGELDPIVGQNGLDAMRHGFQQVSEEIPGCAPLSLADQLISGPVSRFKDWHRVATRLDRNIKTFMATIAIEPLSHDGSNESKPVVSVTRIARAARSTPAMRPG